jgi:hypothetical protein
MVRTRPVYIASTYVEAGLSCPPKREARRWKTRLVRYGWRAGLKSRPYVFNKDPPLGTDTGTDYAGNCRSGIGRPANILASGLAISRVMRWAWFERALSVEMPVLAYICR